ncbi:VOC family protein [Kribbella sp. NBC_01245]|uniref:VOC family protein n=1 Tax=Kribbella sp. NBC_01245 TaxID=2903578 RepID=UPI002E2BD189|nr:VOC family protein [Kribbella sp. NBC_01245]
MSTETQQKKNVIGVWPTLVYHDGAAAIRFLTEGLGFRLIASFPGKAEGSIAHSELLWPTGGGVMVSSIDRGVESDFNVLADNLASIYLVHDDPDSLLQRALAAGAKVVRPMRDEDYGSRGFTVSDHEGNFWSVGTYAGETP